jgi:hypothetical protein
MRNPECLAESIVEVLEANGIASVSRKTLAIVEFDDLTHPVLVPKALEHGGAFRRLFELNVLVQEFLAELQLPVILRLSMYGQPVGETICSRGGNLPERNMRHDGIPEQR